MSNLVEQHVTCPYCGERLEVLFDPSIPHQNYIEDCEVCCNPIMLKISIDDNSISSFEASNIEQ